MIERFGSRLIAIGILCLLVIALLLFGCDQWQKRKAAGSQARVDVAQGQAKSDSAGDAINTVAVSGARESASDELTRSNDKEIRNADGADQKVGAGVDAAGRRSLCRRAAYRDDPKCKLLSTPAK